MRVKGKAMIRLGSDENRVKLFCWRNGAQIYYKYMHYSVNIFCQKIAWAFENISIHNVGQYFILRVEASQVSREGMKLVGTDDI